MAELQITPCVLVGKDNQNQTECKYYLNQSLYSSVGIWNDVNQTKNSNRDIIYLFTYLFTERGSCNWLELAFLVSA